MVIGYWDDKERISERMEFGYLVRRNKEENWHDLPLFNMTNLPFFLRNTGTGYGQCCSYYMARTYIMARTYGICTESDYKIL